MWFGSLCSLLTSSGPEFLEVFGDFAEELSGHLCGDLDGAGDHAR